MILIALALASAPPTDPKGFEQLWAQSKTFLEPAGIDRHMFKVALHWTELQFHLGYCQPYIKDADFLHWREWWKGTVLERTDVGRQLLLTADEVFNEGIRERSKSPPTAELCQRTAANWSRDMKTAIEEVPIAKGAQ